MMLNEDINIFFDEFAVVATLPSGEAKCLFDEEYLNVDFAAEGRSITALFITSTIAQLNHYDLITINGQDYQVVGIRPVDDGKITEIVLSETTGNP